MEEDKIKVIIVEDDDIIRESFAALLNDSDDLCCIANYGDCETAIKNLLNDKPDIVLMDISLPGISGIEGIKRIKKLNSSVELIAVTVHENDNIVFDALCAGACGYLTKNVPPKKIIDSVKEAYNGGSPMSTNIARMVVQSFHKSNSSPLSARETEVLQHLSQGKSYTMIAEELFIDKETVRTHIKNIYQKLEVHSKAEALEKASREKFI
jgi:DNA-binding NarL/FixJ family response regulator